MCQAVELGTHDIYILDIILMEHDWKYLFERNTKACYQCIFEKSNKRLLLYDYDMYIRTGCIKYLLNSFKILT